MGKETKIQCFRNCTLPDDAPRPGLNERGDKPLTIELRGQPWLAHFRIPGGARLKPEDSADKDGNEIEAPESDDSDEVAKLKKQLASEKKKTIAAVDAAKSLTLTIKNNAKNGKGAPKAPDATADI